MRKVTLFLVPLALLSACSDPCEKAGDRITAKYEECGIDVGEDTGGGEEVECTKEEEEAAICTADCVEAADCAALDGSDTDLALEYVDCLTGCI